MQTGGDHANTTQNGPKPYLTRTIFRLMGCLLYYLVYLLLSRKKQQANPAFLVNSLNLPQSNVKARVLTTARLKKLLIKRFFPHFITLNWRTQGPRFPRRIPYFDSSDHRSTSRQSRECISVSEFGVYIFLFEFHSVIYGCILTTQSILY